MPPSITEAAENTLVRDCQKGSKSIKLLSGEIVQTYGMHSPITYNEILVIYRGRRDTSGLQEQNLDC